MLYVFIQSFYSCGHCSRLRIRSSINSACGLNHCRSTSKWCHTLDGIAAKCIFATNQSGSATSCGAYAAQTVTYSSACRMLVRATTMIVKLAWELMSYFICSKETKKYENRQQPLLISNYNNGMGGVDLHDNAVENYRINVRVKKWYWPLWISILSSSIVNAWKLHCAIYKHQNRTRMSQKDFRIFIAENLLLTPDTSSSDDDYEPEDLPKLSGKHYAVKYEDKKQRRCKIPSCKGKSTFYCEKCNVCLHPNECFKQYHEDKSKDIPHFKMFGNK